MSGNHAVRAEPPRARLTEVNCRIEESARTICKLAMQDGGQDRICIELAWLRELCGRRATILNEIRRTEGRRLD